MKREIVLIIFGLLFIVGGVFTLAKNSSSSLPLKKTAEAKEVPTESSAPSWPAWISIEKSGITAQVVEGGYEDGKWILDGKYVLYLPENDKLGDGGNTVLYAHNRDKLFGNLKKTSIGDIIAVRDSNGKTYNYKVYSLEYIKSYEIKKINTDKENTITLFTCDGWFDEKRLIVKAEIVS